MPVVGGGAGNRLGVILSLDLTGTNIPDIITRWDANEMLNFIKTDNKIFPTLVLC